MAHERSSTTAAAVAVDDQDGQQEFQQLMAHNATTQFPHEQFPVDTSGFAHSGTNSSYGSPEPGNLLVDHYGQSYNSSYLPQYRGGPAEQTDEYGTPMYYPNPTSGYYASPPTHQTPYHNYYVSSPPTPAASEQSSNGKRKREARSLAPSRSVSRTSHSPRPKKSKQTKGEKAKIPQIEAPLSVLTKDYKNIPVKDMNAWVNRSVETRQAEVDKRKGKITRPMNSFMLYRSAYAERTKVWCLQNNHQVVSSVSGESWPMEPKEIRDLYTEYARVERDNHQKAHPGYKFSPSKAGAASRKRREASEEAQEEPSDLDDLDSEWKPARKQHLRTTDPQQPTTNMSYGNYTNDHVPSRSLYQYSNPGKPLPTPMSNDEMYRHYYQTSVHANIGAPYTEDVFVHRAHIPGQTFGTQSPLVGIPGRNHLDFLPEQSGASSPATYNEPQVDPYLLGQDDDPFGGLPAAVSPQYGVRGFDHGELFTAEMQPSTYEDDPTFTQGMESWQFAEERSPGTAAAGFDNWMEPTEDS